MDTNKISAKVEQSDWATPTVNIKKTNQSIRICGDHKVTVYPHVDLEQYPLPTAEDIYATLAGGNQFTKLDLAHAYNQMWEDDESESEKMHIQRLDEVLTRLEWHGIHLKLSKWEFLQTQIEYVGHVVAADGIRPSSTKVDALRVAPRQTNVAELSSYLGLLKYDMKFMSDLSTLLHPLNLLTHLGVKWKKHFSAIRS